MSATVKSRGVLCPSPSAAYAKPPFTISGWIATARQRRALRNLDAEQLRDIGITREEALAEARRPFWDAPHFWVK